MLSIATAERPRRPSDSEVWTVSPDGSNPIKVFDSDGCDMGATNGRTPGLGPQWNAGRLQRLRRWVVANADGTGEAQPIDELV